MYRWINSLKDLKIFVRDILNIQGKWSSPGGDVKFFESDGEGEFAIKWYGPRSKRILIQRDNQGQDLKLKFESLASQCQSNDSMLQEAENITCRPIDSEVCACVNVPFLTQLESLKVDIITLESRFNGELVNEINSLRTKQNALESIIRKQDDVIRKVNDDNTLLKSRLLSLEKLLSTRALEYDFENNSLTPAIPSDHCIPTVNDQPNDSNLNTLSVNGLAPICEINISEEPVNTVQDQSCVLNLSSSRSPKTVNYPSNKELASNCSKTQKAIPTIDLESNDKPNKVKRFNGSSSFIQHNNMLHYSKKRNSANVIPNSSVPKHLISCPFLKRRGYCLKGSSCDFLHNNFDPHNVMQRPQNTTGYAPSLSFQSNFNHSPFPVDPRHFPPFQVPPYYHMFRPSPYPLHFPCPSPLPYPPPLMSTLTRPPTC